MARCGMAWIRPVAAPLPPPPVRLTDSAGSDLLIESLSESSHARGARSSLTSLAGMPPLTRPRPSADADDDSHAFDAASVLRPHMTKMAAAAVSPAHGLTSWGRSRPSSAHADGAAAGAPRGPLPPVLALCVELRGVADSRRRLADCGQCVPRQEVGQRQRRGPAAASATSMTSSPTTLRQLPSPYAILCGTTCRCDPWARDTTAAALTAHSRLCSARVRKRSHAIAQRSAALLSDAHSPKLGCTHCARRLAPVRRSSTRASSLRATGTGLSRRRRPDRRSRHGTSAAMRTPMTASGTAGG
jgi:hypothetical protein